MNDTVARFAAMAERAARDESPPAVAVPPRALSGSCGASIPEVRRGEPLLRRLGENEQQALDRAVAEELDSLGRDDPPPPAPDRFGVHDQPVDASTARGRAIAYVEKLIRAYMDLRRSPGAYKVNVTAKIDHLRLELGIMQASGTEGEQLARRWDFVVFG